MTRDAAASHIAAGQHGLLTRHQARSVGMTDREIHHRCATGRWVILRRSVFAIVGAPPRWEQSVLAACLAAGPGAVASDLTAGRLWGLSLPEPDRIEVMSTGSSRRRQPGVTHHRRSNVAPVDVTVLAGIPLTTPARTLVDAAGRVPAERLGVVVDDALRRKVVLLSALRSCHWRVDTGPGRRPTLALRQVLAERAPGYDAGGSDRERWVLRVLATAGMALPVQQHRVRVGATTTGSTSPTSPNGWRWSSTAGTPTAP